MDACPPQPPTQPLTLLSPGSRPPTRSPAQGRIGGRGGGRLRRPLAARPQRRPHGQRRHDLDPGLVGERQRPRALLADQPGSGRRQLVLRLELRLRLRLRLRLAEPVVQSSAGIHPHLMSPRRFKAMGCEIVVGGATPSEQVAVERLFAALEASLSRFRPTSDLERLNRSPAGTVIVSPLLATALDDALRAAQATDGLCDPTIAAALRVGGLRPDLRRDRARPARERGSRGPLARDPALRPPRPATRRPAPRPQRRRQGTRGRRRAGAARGRRLRLGRRRPGDARRARRRAARRRHRDPQFGRARDERHRRRGRGLAKETTVPTT